MKHFLLYGTAAGVLALDRLSKCLWGEAELTLIPGVLALHGTRNAGAAFGLLAGQGGWLAALGVVLCAAVPLILRGRTLSRRCQLGAGLLLGGALGNLLDRLLLGYVIDFIDPVFLHWFIFNLADAGVVCGAVLLMFCLLFEKEGRP